MINVEKIAPAAVAQPVYSEWERFMASTNGRAPTSMKRAYQTSKLWVRMITEETVVSQFERSVIISALITGSSLLFFTANIVMSVYSSLCVGAIMVCVVGFIIFAGWEIGLIEALCLLLLIGFSVDYILHISHAYCHSESASPIESVQHAVRQIGLSIFSSAMTTAVSSVPLLFCMIQLFAKIGAVLDILHTAYTTMVYVVMAFIIMAYMAYTIMACIVMAQDWCGPGHISCSSSTLVIVTN